MRRIPPMPYALHELAEAGTHAAASRRPEALAGMLATPPFAAGWIRSFQSSVICATQYPVGSNSAAAGPPRAGPPRPPPKAPAGGCALITPARASRIVPDVASEQRGISSLYE